MRDYEALEAAERAQAEYDDLAARCEALESTVKRIKRLPIWSDSEGYRFVDANDFERILEELDANT